MPIHQFQHEESGEIIEEYVPAAAPAADHQKIERNGKVYKRVYVAPLAARDTKVGSGSIEDFRRMTDEKRMKNGDLWEISKQMSEEREAKHGRDPVKEKHYRDFERLNGVKCMQELKEERARKVKQITERLGLGVE